VRIRGSALPLLGGSLHVLASGCVKSIVSALRFSAALLVVSAFAADAPLPTVLRDLEGRYNHAKTLQVLFTEVYTPKGGIQQSESGTLLLRKPGRMRWNYLQPKGKLVVSDGSFLYIYSPTDNRAQKMNLKDSMVDEMQAPLAFLLGKLNFDKEFKNLQARPDGNDLRITGEPKNDNLPYSAVDFVVTSQNQIRQLKISMPAYTLEFTFSMEKMDPQLDAKLFAFQLPAGAQWAEAAR
jgi:outer membrane lipoprotein carrier protein